jgi:hypothetical protein
MSWLRDRVPFRVAALAYGAREAVPFRVEFTTKYWVEYEDRKGTRSRVPKRRIPPPYFSVAVVTVRKAEE